MKKIVLLAFVWVLLLWGCLPVVSLQEIPRLYHMIALMLIEPETVDPAWAYDTASQELIFNVYDTLIFFDRERADIFVPSLATEWTISEGDLTYTFKIREGVTFHNGALLTPADVEYSFERWMVQCRAGGPAWMILEPLLGIYSTRKAKNTTDTAIKIRDSVQSNATHVWFNLVMPYSPLLCILAQSCASTLNKDWCIEDGGWPGTWGTPIDDGANWTAWNNPEVSPLDSPEPVMCGTGPYVFDYWEKGVEWSIVKFSDYWGGWPARGRISACRGYVSRVTEKFVPEWESRRDMFLAGEADMVYVPRMYMKEVWGLPGIRCIYPLPSLAVTAMFFNFNVSTTSPYMGVPGGLPPGTFDESGIPPDFFSDLDVRKGFAYSFDYDTYIKDVYLGEATQPVTCVVNGLPYQNPAQEKYYFNLTKSEERFETAWGGNVWTNGFTFTVMYRSGNEPRRKVCEMLKANVEMLNPKFHINVLAYDWYYDWWIWDELPMFIIGWLADYPDPHNFVHPFMHNDGTFAYLQSYSNPHVDELVEAGIRTFNITRRKETYYELQSIYHEDCPSVPLVQPVGRHWERDWVQGWYYNPAYPGLYFYHLWKVRPIPEDINMDGRVDIRDITIVALAFGSKLGDENWNAIADLNDDEVVDIKDVTIVALEFGKTL